MGFVLNSFTSVLIIFQSTKVPACKGKNHGVISRWCGDIKGTGVVSFLTDRLQVLCLCTVPQYSTVHRCNVLYSTPVQYSTLPQHIALYTNNLRMSRYIRQRDHFHEARLLGQITNTATFNIVSSLDRTLKLGSY